MMFLDFARRSRRALSARSVALLLCGVVAAGFTACSDSSTPIEEPGNFRGVVVSAADGTPLEAEVWLNWLPDDCWICPGRTFATKTSSTGTFDLRFDLAKDQYQVNVSSPDRFAVPGAGLELFRGYLSQSTYAPASDLAAAEVRYELVPAGMVEYRLSRPLVDGERVTVNATGDRYGATGAAFNPGGPNPRFSLSAAGTSPIAVNIVRPDETLDVRTGSVTVEHRGYTLFTVEMD